MKYTLYNRPTSLLDMIVAPYDRLDTPRANILSNDKGMTIEVELPGFSRSDISIESKGVTLTVSAKRTDETRDEVRAQEFSTHHLARSWTLPKTIDVEKIVASYEAGILTLKMPYRGDAVSETRRIEIA